MTDLRLQSEFASVCLRVLGAGCTAERRQGSSAAPAPAVPALIDWCLTDALQLDCATGSDVTLEPEIMPAPGWHMERENGEHLCGFTFARDVGDRAAIGLRDLDWLQDTTGLVLIEDRFDSMPARATLRTKTAVAFDLQIALALTRNPASPAQALAPWLAVDRLMKP